MHIMKYLIGKGAGMNKADNGVSGPKNTKKIEPTERERKMSEKLY